MLLEWRVCVVVLVAVVVVVVRGGGGVAIAIATQQNPRLKTTLAPVEQAVDNVRGFKPDLRWLSSKYGTGTQKELADFEVRVCFSRSGSRGGDAPAAAVAAVAAVVPAARAVVAGGGDDDAGDEPVMVVVAGGVVACTRLVAPMLQWSRYTRLSHA
jgi:hypothetical protein